MADCLCDKLLIESCPPYASEKDFNEYLKRDCNVCSGVVPVNTTLANLKTAAGIDTCCKEVIINRGQQVIFSIDGGNTWSETGVRRISAVTEFGSTNFTVNVTVTPNHTGANTTIHEQQVPINFTNNRLTVTEGGTYMYSINFVIAPNAAFNGNMRMDMMVNGSNLLPRVGTSWYINLSSSATLFHTISGVINLEANDGISFIYTPGVTFTSTITSTYIDLWKVSS